MTGARADFGRWVLLSDCEVLSEDHPILADTTTEPLEPAQSLRTPSVSAPSRTRQGTDESDVPSAISELGSMPDLAAHERDRKIGQKRPAPSGQRLGRLGAHKSKASKVSVSDRCKEFNHPTDQQLRVHHGEIFCHACHVAIFNKHSTIKVHCAGVKHVENVKKALERQASDQLVAYELNEHFMKHPNEDMASVPVGEMVYRLRVVETFLGNGVPLAKTDGFRTLLQRADQQLCASTHLKAFIPKIEQNELNMLNQEVLKSCLHLLYHCDRPTLQK